MADFGLIGKNIDYSFSRAYFTGKFEKAKLSHNYSNFDLNTIEEFPKVIKSNQHLRGLNVTIPYKLEVIPYLDELSNSAKKIGAVNTIKITKKGKLKGYNTDHYGFRKSLEPLLDDHHSCALILGSGGASLAVKYALKKLDIDYLIVSRNPSEENMISYNSLDENIINSHKIIINCSPIGTFPNTDKCPDIPYEFIGKEHILYDLVYNPPLSLFLKKGESKGTKTINGHEMLVLQAERSWKIWMK